MTNAFQCRQVSLQVNKTLMDEVSFSDLSIVASGGVSYSKDLIYLLNTRLRTNRTSLWVWGYNSSGQLGLDDTTDRLKPVVLDFFNGREIKKVVQSASSSYVLTSMQHTLLNLCSGWLLICLGK